MITTPTAPSQEPDPGAVIAELRRANAALQAERDELSAGRDAALAREAALADVLGIINASPADLAPVFDTMLERAMRLSGAACGGLFTYDGKAFHTAATRGVPRALADFRARHPPTAAGSQRVGLLLDTRRPVHTLDVTETDAYRTGDMQDRAMADLGGARTILNVPLLKDDAVVGFISVYRTEKRAFDDKEVALLQNFAAQAVIAMENARLITEQREALDQQTATADVLRIINASPGDLAPVFDAILEKAHSLCGAPCGSLQLYDGEHFRAVALRGMAAPFAAMLKQGYRPSPDNLRLSGGERPVQIADLVDFLAQSAVDDPIMRATVDLAGLRTLLVIPLRKDDVLLGRIVAARQEVQLFSDKQIALLESFAAQAVIAIENARLLEALRERTEALARRNSEFGERIEQQAATIDVLKVMSSSPGDPQPVFDLIALRSRDLCNGLGASVFEYDGELVYHRAITPGEAPDEELAAYDALFPMPPTRGSLTCRAILDRQIVHVRDLQSEDVLPAVRNLGYRSQLTIPFLRDGVVIGAITLSRREAGGFTDGQVALLQTFAEQAVIAITSAENHRALQQRTAELDRAVAEQREALEQQRASAEILNVISTSVADPQPVFEKILDSCKVLFGGDELDVLLVDEQGLLQVAAYLGEAQDVILPTFPAPWEITPVAPAIRDRRVAHYPDVMSNPDTPQVLRRVGEIVGYHSIAFAPMVWEDRGIGAIGVARSRGAFSDRELEIMQGFADQAVIAIQNARMFREVRNARDTAETALRNLKTAQANLIQSEKMASLGQLTAGIAHEIKNPLNFVNNFARLSVGLLDELKGATEPAMAALDEERRAEIDEVVHMLTGNLEKIAEHGQRADGIVKGMLAHSRGGTGQRQSADINGLLEESLNLAYHGARAQDQQFNITLERDYDPALGPVELVPQDITRVFLNLCGNGFYAASKRLREAGPAGYRPVLKVATRDLGDAVEVRIRDNGIGVPPDIKDKLFQPFFTTKPTGEGTGLGLSISYDIVTQQHGGSIAVDSQVGDFTEFTIRLPRSR